MLDYNWGFFFVFADLVLLFGLLKVVFFFLCSDQKEGGFCFTFLKKCYFVCIDRFFFFAT